MSASPHVLETVASLTSFLLYMERKKHATTLAPPKDLRIQPTVIIQHSMFTDLFRWSPTSGITRDTQALSPQYVASVLGMETRKTTDISESQDGTGKRSPRRGGKYATGPSVAYMVERRCDNPLTSTTSHLSTQYLTARHLRNYMLYGDLDIDELNMEFEMTREKPDRTGLLQLMVQPVGAHVECIRVVYENGNVAVKQRRTATAYNAPRTVPYERCVTFDGPKHMSHLDTVMDNTKETLTTLASEMAEYLGCIERRVVQHLTLYFKVDEAGVPWFQWCQKVRFEGTPVHRDVYDIQFRYPLQFRSRSHLHPKYDCVHEEDLVEMPTMNATILVPDQEVILRKQREMKARERRSKWELQTIVADDSRASTLTLPTMYNKSMFSVHKQFPNEPPQYEPSRATFIAQQLAELERRKNPPKKQVAPVDPTSHFLSHTGVWEQRRAQSVLHRKELDKVSSSKHLLDALDGTHRLSSKLVARFGLKKSEVKLLENTAKAREELKAGRSSSKSSKSNKDHTLHSNLFSTSPRHDTQRNMSMMSPEVETNKKLAGTNNINTKKYAEDIKKRQHLLQKRQMMMTSFTSTMRSTLSSTSRTQNSSDLTKTVNESIDEQRQLRLLMEKCDEERKMWQSLLESNHSGSVGSAALIELASSHSNVDDLDDGLLVDSGTTSHYLNDTAGLPLPTLLQQERVSGLEGFPSMLERHRELCHVVELVEDFFEGLQYHLTQHFHREKAVKRINGVAEATPSNPLIISLPPGVAVLERSMEDFLRSLPHAHQLNNSVNNLHRMRALITRQKTLMSTGLAMEELFTWHLRVDDQDDSALRAVATFAFVKEPNRLDVSERVKSWLDRTLRSYVVTELAEIQEEVLAGLGGRGK